MQSSSWLSVFLFLLLLRHWLSCGKNCGGDRHSHVQLLSEHFFYLNLFRNYFGSHYDVCSDFIRRGNKIELKKPCRDYASGLPSMQFNNAPWIHRYRGFYIFFSIIRIFSTVRMFHLPIHCVHFEFREKEILHWVWRTSTKIPKKPIWQTFTWKIFVAYFLKCGKKNFSWFVQDCFWTLAIVGQFSAKSAVLLGRWCKIVCVLHFTK